MVSIKTVHLNPSIPLNVQYNYNITFLLIGNKIGNQEITYASKLVMRLLLSKLIVNSAVDWPPRLRFQTQLIHDQRSSCVAKRIKVQPIENGCKRDYGHPILGAMISDSFYQQSLNHNLIINRTKLGLEPEPWLVLNPLVINGRYTAV